MRIDDGILFLRLCPPCSTGGWEGNAPTTARACHLTASGPHSPAGVSQYIWDQAKSWKTLGTLLQRNA